MNGNPRQQTGRPEEQRCVGNATDMNGKPRRYDGLAVPTGLDNKCYVWAAARLPAVLVLLAAGAFAACFHEDADEDGIDDEGSDDAVDR